MKIFLVIVCFLFIPSKISAQPTEKNLLEAWEHQQKTNPHTVVFKKLDERRYKYKTIYFLFDGELKVIKIIINDKFDEASGTIAGYVDVELVGFDKYEADFYIYNAWDTNNGFLYDPKLGKWQSLLRQDKITLYQGFLSKKELDKQLRNIWKLANECLKKGDIEGALKFIFPDQREKNRELLEALKPHLPEIISNRVEFDLIELRDDGIARYNLVYKDGEHLYSDEITFFVFFGHWWIQDF